GSRPPATSSSTRMSRMIAANGLVDCSTSGSFYLQFAKARTLAVAGTPSVAMAEQVLRGIVVTKLKLGGAVILLAAALASGITRWAIHKRRVDAAHVPAEAALLAPSQRPEAPQDKAPPLPERVTRTIRGVVRDEQGRPVAKAWIGHGGYELGE